jgi:hypothetical protein
MFLAMSTRPAIRSLTTLWAVAAFAGGVCAQPVLARSAASPSPAQIHSAVHRAAHSENLWATVNVCDTPNYPNYIGIRGQMPALGFSSALSMQVRVDYWSFARSGFVPVRGAKKTVNLGTASSGLYQNGYFFRFKPSLILRGTITFQWRRQGKVIGSAVRHTGGYYHRVMFSDPPGFSRPTCTIK